MRLEMRMERLETAESVPEKQVSLRPGLSPHAVSATAAVSSAPAASSAPAVSAAPMASAPFRYRSDGEVDWGNMWDTFCALALDGSPPHRGTMLEAPLNPNVDSVAYQYVVAEIIRGIAEVSGLQAETADPGWLRIACRSAAEAAWLAEAILSENVAAHHNGRYLFLPVGEAFTVKGEIKNVITAVAKTTHYWNDHLAAEVKQTLAAQEALGQLIPRLFARIRQRFNR